jgi:hypothetical protein
MDNWIFIAIPIAAALHIIEEYGGYMKRLPMFLPFHVKKKSR